MDETRIRRQRADDSKSNSEVRDQMSEVRAKLISDLRRLTSVTDDFNGLNNLNG
jgi:hypothetical protein